MESFSLVAGLDQCKKIIVCDGYSIIKDEKKEQTKRSIVHQQSADNYEQFIKKIQLKCSQGIYRHSTVYVQSANVGFAENISTAINEYVDTEFILIVQHDQLFVRQLSLFPLVECLKRNDAINYIGFNSDSNKNEVNCRLQGPQFKKFYHDLECEINRYVCDNGGKSVLSELLHHPEFPLSSLLKKKDSAGTQGISNDSIGDSESQCNDFECDYISFRKDNTPDRMLVTHVILNYTTLRYGLPLMPLVFWYDKTHLSRTDYYRTSVLNNCVSEVEKLKISPVDRCIHTNVLQIHTRNSVTGGMELKRQPIRGFIEDTLGVVHKNNIILYGMSYFQLYCCAFVLYDKVLCPAIKHSNGRSFLTEETLLKCSQHSSHVPVSSVDMDIT